MSSGKSSETFRAIFDKSRQSSVWQSLSRNTINLTDSRNRVVIFVSDEPLLFPKKQKTHMDEITLLLAGISLWSCILAFMYGTITASLKTHAASASSWSALSSLIVSTNNTVFPFAYPGCVAVPRESLRPQMPAGYSQSLQRERAGIHIERSVHHRLLHLDPESQVSPPAHTNPFTHTCRHLRGLNLDRIAFSAMHCAIQTAPSRDASVSFCHSRANCTTKPAKDAVYVVKVPSVGVKRASCTQRIHSVRNL